MNLLLFWSSSMLADSLQLSHLIGLFIRVPSCASIVTCSLGQTKAASWRSGRSSEVLTTIPENAIILSRYEVSTFLSATLSVIPLTLTWMYLLTLSAYGAFSALIVSYPAFLNSWRDRSGS